MIYTHKSLVKPFINTDKPDKEKRGFCDDCLNILPAIKEMESQTKIEKRLCYLIDTPIYWIDKYLI